MPVALTPNGYADGIALNEKDGKEYFVMPEEGSMKMRDFLHALDDRRLCKVAKSNQQLLTKILLPVDRSATFKDRTLTWSLTFLSLLMTLIIPSSVSPQKRSTRNRTR